MLDPRLLIVLAQVFMFADSKGLDVTVTSIKSGRDHLTTTSETHADYRAIDIRSRNWPTKYKRALVKKINKDLGHLGAVGLLTGSRKVIIFERDTGSGEHFHIQVAKLIKDKECLYGKRESGTRESGTRDSMPINFVYARRKPSSKTKELIKTGTTFCKSSTWERRIYARNN